VLSLVIGLSEMRIHTSIELLHLGLQPLLKVGLTLPVLLRNQPYKHEQATGNRSLKFQASCSGACHGRYKPFVADSSYSC